MSSLARGGALVAFGGTTGLDVPLNLLQIFADQLIVSGWIMGTLKNNRFHHFDATVHALAINSWIAVSNNSKPTG